MKVAKKARRSVLWFLFLCSSLAIILTGCGGGGGSTSTTDTTLTGTSTTLSGTAATGKAMANAIIKIKDSDGVTTSGSAGADGKYSVDVTSMTPSFLLSATSGTTTLYSVIGATGVANIHPFSDLIIRNWYLAKGTDVDTVFNGTGLLLNLPTVTEIATMQNVIKSILTTQLNLFLDSATFDMFTTAFDANGTGFDAILDNTQVSVNDTVVTVELKDPVLGVIGDILTLPAGTDISKDTNPVTTAIAAVDSGLSGLQATINAKINPDSCTLAGTDIQPYFVETGFMYNGWNIDQLATVLQDWLCSDPSNPLTLTISADYVSYDDATGALRATLTFKASNEKKEEMEQAIWNFKDVSGTWVALGDGLPADIKVRSRVEDHIRAADSTNTPNGFIDKRQIEVIDYTGTITDVSVTDPGSTIITVPLVCDDFTTPGDCDKKPPAKVFSYEDQSLIKGVYKVAISTAIGTSTYEKSIIGTPGADHTDTANFPMFSDISTHDISSVLGTTITASVYTPAWVSEIATPFVSLWSGSTRLADFDAKWVGIPSAGQYNQFTVEIPSTYTDDTNTTWTVTSAVLGQDAMSEVFEGWGQTNVWWYFE